MKSKKFTKLKSGIITFLSILILSLPFQGNVVAAEKVKEQCPSGTCLEKPTSNVSNKEYNNILKKVKNSEEYKVVASKSVIGSLHKSDIIVNKEESSTKSMASVGFIIGKKMQEENLVYVEIIYDLKEDSVHSVKKLHAKLTEDGLISINMVVNENDIFTMNINEQGEIIGDNGNVISQDDFFEQVVSSLDTDKVTTYGWCEWVMAALCGAGGGAACYAAAVALGLTTGVGGFALATVCALIGSLGCTAATKKVCG